MSHKFETQVAVGSLDEADSVLPTNNFTFDSDELEEDLYQPNIPESDAIPASSSVFIGTAVDSKSQLGQSSFVSARGSVRLFSFFTSTFFHRIVLIS